MRKLFYLLLILSVGFVSCQKEDFADELAEAEAELAIANAKIDDLEDTIATLIQQGNADIVDVSTYEAQIVALQNDINSLESMIADLQSSANADEALIASLQSDLADANESLEDALVKIDGLEAQITELEQDLLSAEIDADNYLAQIEALEDSLEEAGSEIVYVTNIVTETVEIIKEVEVEVVVTEVVTETVEVEVPVVQVVTEVVTVTIVNTVTETIEIEVPVEVIKVVTETIEVEVEVEVEVTPLTFVGDGGLKLYSDETLEDNNFVTYNLFKTSSSTFIDLDDIKSMISVNTDLDYTVQVVDPIAGDNKLSVRITFTNGNPTEGIIIASISGAYYETPAANSETEEAEETEGEETEEEEAEEPADDPEPVAVECNYTPNVSKSDVSTSTYTEWENVGEPDNADATEQYTTQEQQRTKTEVVTTTTTTSYTKSDASCEDKADVVVVTDVTNVTTETQTIQVANPDYEADAVNINGHIYQENIVSSIASVTYGEWSPWVTYGQVDKSFRSVSNFTVQTTSYLPHDFSSPAIPNKVENINVVNTTEERQSVVISVHGNYERVDVGGTHGITNFKAGQASTYNVYLSGTLTNPLVVINLTGSGGSGSSKKNGYTINYSYTRDAALNYFIDLSVTSDVNISVTLNN